VHDRHVRQRVLHALVERTHLRSSSGDAPPVTRPRHWRGVRSFLRREPPQIRPSKSAKRTLNDIGRLTIPVPHARALRSILAHPPKIWHRARASIARLVASRYLDTGPLRPVNSTSNPMRLRARTMSRIPANLSTSLAFSIALAVLFVAPAPTDAQIYRYEMPDGTVLYTTEPQRNMSATEVIGEGRTTRNQRNARGDRVINDPPDRPNPNPTRSPDAFDDIIREASAMYGIPFEFVKAVIRAESAFDPFAVSRAGAMGLMQLMPGTAEALGCDDPFDPRSNILAGTHYLAILTSRYNGEINMVLAAYNAGSGAVANANGIPYADTRRYIQRVVEYYFDYLDANTE